MLRVVAGFVGCVILGWACFGRSVFLLGNTRSQVIILGGLAVGVLALFRIGRPVQGVAVALAFAVVQIPLSLITLSQGGLDWTLVVLRTLATFGWSLFVALGICLVCAIYDRLAAMGFWFFKFLIIGPLLGGIYLAAGPLAGLASGRPETIPAALWLNGLLGIVIGDGVALGVELIELLPALRTPIDLPFDDAGGTPPA